MKKVKNTLEYDEVFNKACEKNGIKLSENAKIRNKNLLVKNGVIYKITQSGNVQKCIFRTLLYKIHKNRN